MASKQKNSISAKSESVVKIFVARIGSGNEAQLFAAKGANCFLLLISGLILKSFELKSALDFSTFGEKHLLAKILERVIKCGRYLTGFDKFESVAALFGGNKRKSFDRQKRR